MELHQNLKKIVHKIRDFKFKDFKLWEIVSSSHVVVICLFNLVVLNLLGYVTETL